MEPLAESIRSNQDISGFHIGSNEHKINVFADDVIVMLSQLVPPLSAKQIPLLMARWIHTVSMHFPTKKNSSLHQANYASVLQALPKDLEALTKPILSWSGWVVLFKMCKLPQLLYLFGWLPIPIPISFFRSIQSIIGHFIWLGKNPGVLASSWLSMGKWIEPALRALETIKRPVF